MGHCLAIAMDRHCFQEIDNCFEDQSCVDVYNKTFEECDLEETDQEFDSYCMIKQFNTYGVSN